MTEKALALLRSALWHQPCEVSINSSEWEGILVFASEQTLDGLMVDALHYLSSESMPIKAIKMQMISRQMQVENSNLRMNEELLAFTAKLEQNNIPHVLLKGQGVASFYPNPLHRVSGDIDLYVPIAHYNTANTMLLSYGGIRSHETRHHIDYNLHGILWELHHCVHYFQNDRRNKVFMSYLDEAMVASPVHAPVGSGQVRVLPPTMNVLLLLSHMLDHFYVAGFGLRQLCDYALLLDKAYNEINREKLFRALDELSITRAYRVLGYMCVHYLGLKVDKLMLSPTEEDKSLAHQIMLDCLRSGNFGRSEAPDRNTLWNWLRYYGRFIWRLMKFGRLCPNEAIWWPLAKFKRFVTGTVYIDETKSILNSTSK